MTFLKQKLTIIFPKVNTYIWNNYWANIVLSDVRSNGHCSKRYKTNNLTLFIVLKFNLKKYR